jgi:hypothetical protein
MSTATASTTLPYYAEDISALARALARQLEATDHKLSHVEILNVLARANGHRNYQHLRASGSAMQRLAESPRVVVDVDYTKIERLAQNFDARGRLTRWPKKFSLQLPCMWVIWSTIPPREKFDETRINEIIKSAHTFSDHATLRRELVNYGLVTRNLDCSDYQRVEREPPREVLTLLRLLRSRSLSPGADRSPMLSPRRADEL